jgi:hypothetical protein
MSTLIILFKLIGYGLSGGLLWHEIRRDQSPIAQRAVKIFGVLLIIVAISQTELWPLLWDKLRNVQPLSFAWKTIDRYEVKDDLVKDTKTGLMWMRCSFGQTWTGAICAGEPKRQTWQQHAKEAEAYNHAGYDDWRLPTIGELQTLVYCSSEQPSLWNDTDERCAGDYSRPTLLKAVFGNTPENRFWSSTPYSYGHRFLDFDYGSVNYRGNESSYIARLVRVEP